MKDKVKEIGFYQLDLNQFNPGTGDCNFTIVISPEFLEKYRGQRQEYGTRWHEFLDAIAQEVGLVSLTSDIDTDARLNDITAKRQHETNSPEGQPFLFDNFDFQLRWDTSRQSYLTEGVKNPTEFILLFNLFNDYELKQWLCAIEEKEGYKVTPPWIVNMGHLGAGINIQTSAKFNQQAEKLIASTPNFAEEFGERVFTEVKRRGMEGLADIIYLPRSWFSGKKKGLHMISTIGSASMIHRDDNDMHFWPSQDGGALYTCHNIDTSYQSSYILFIFWLFTEEVRKFHRVDFL